MSVDLATVQALAGACLAANATLAAVPRFLELDPAASAEDLRTAEEGFVRALSTVGFAIIVGYPVMGRAAQATAGLHATSRATVDLTVPIGFCENEVINRGPADLAATPPITPSGLRPQRAIDQAIPYLFREFRLPPQPLGRPVYDEAESFWVHTLFVERTHTYTRA